MKNLEANVWIFEITTETNGREPILPTRSLGGGGWEVGEILFPPPSIPFPSLPLFLAACHSY